MEQLTDFLQKTILPNIPGYANGSNLLDYDDGDQVSSELHQVSSEEMVSELKNLGDLSAFQMASNFTNGSMMTGNSTLVLDGYREITKLALDILLLLILILIMLAMGCEIKLVNLWGHIKRPIGLSIGIISQFGIKPLAAFAVLAASGVEGLHATGVLIISCCPGGVLSNTFTYFSDGDLPLSVAMTTASTIMAMGMLPANIWLYGRYFESIDLVIPYQKMALSLLIVTSPIAVGMLMKWKLPRLAKWTTKVGTWSGLLLMLVGVIIEAVIFPNMFTSASATLYAIILTLPGIGLGLGYGIAALMRQEVPICKTIAIECGVQNFPLALTVITLSFPLEMQGDLVLLPWLYGFAMIVGCTILCGIYQIHKKYKEHKALKEKNVNGIKEGVNVDDPEREDLMPTNGVHIQMKPCKLSLNGTNSVKV